MLNAISEYLRRPNLLRDTARFFVRIPLWVVRGGRRLLYGLGTVAIIALIFVFAVNIAFHTPYNVAFRALDPDSEVCKPPAEGWDYLAKVGNDEWRAVDELKTTNGAPVLQQLNCAIQTHRVSRWKAGENGAPDVMLAPAKYDLAFLEFQENGDPYVLCSSSQFADGNCDGWNSAPKKARGQLEALQERLKSPSTKNFVIAFVHGWRHTAQVGDGNVADLRIYTAHAARFVLDRCEAGDKRYCGMKVTGVYVGWRGARTDETRINRMFIGPIKAMISSNITRTLFVPINDLLSSPKERFCTRDRCFLLDLPGQVGTFGAALTLFDRKPVSESVAPNVLAALQSIEATIGAQKAYRESDLAPCDHADLAVNAIDAGRADDSCWATTQAGYDKQARMLVLGHSLGGNLLISALRDELVKRVELHKPGVVGVGGAPDRPADFIPAPLGSLTVLINPAAEAAKWTAAQRAVWDRIVMANWEKGRSDEYKEGALFFHPQQRPAIVSVTSARDWPPGGLRPFDCAALDAARDSKDPDSRALTAVLQEELKRRNREINYDWATYDLFPLFRFDFRPVASSLDRYATREPVGEGQEPRCEQASSRGMIETINRYGVWRASVHWFAGLLRVFPFMNTEVEQTRTIGHLDPPRAPQGVPIKAFSTGRPIGTTHELEGWGKDVSLAQRNRKPDSDEEASLPYEKVGGPDGQCAPAANWLTRAREAHAAADPRHSPAFWDAYDIRKQNPPALRFVHGFGLSGIAAITRYNDPFWNVRALDNALAEHDGYMLTSFICALNQLVLDDPTDLRARP